MSKFLLDRLKVADAMADIKDPNPYPDRMLILMTVLSVCAARRWPGTEIDRKRFIELLVRHSPNEAHADWVSVPALINLEIVDEADTLYGEPRHAGRIFCDEDIDLSLEDARKQFPTVDLKRLKSNCYASLIYEWLRCGYAHEYSPHEFVTEYPPSRREARISYITRGTKTPKTVKKVGFHFDYLRKLAAHHVTQLPGSEATKPPTWWLNET